MDCIIYDWLTWSASDLTVRDAICVLGLQDMEWDFGLSSNLLYAWRASCGGISIHYTPDGYMHPEGKKRNSGICVEMSGQGCREFETYGHGDFRYLIWGILENSAYRNISRLDLAFDDHSKIIPIREMAEKAKRHEYTSRLQRRQVIFDCPDGEPDHEAITVYHGSRCSRCSIRCYDKRAQLRRWEEDHWVRLELQLRDEDAMGAARYLMETPVGDVFCGILNNYLTYREPCDDSNKSRWTVSHWWRILIDSISIIHLHSRRDVEYNRNKLDDFVFSHSRNAVVTAIQIYGVDQVVDRLYSVNKSLPKKYRDLIDQAGKNADDILSEIGVKD